MPTEKAKDFGGSIRRLLGLMRPELPKLVTVVVMAIAGVAGDVYGPKVLANATDEIFKGLLAKRTGGGIDMGRLGHFALQALLIYLAAAVLQFVQAYILAGSVQRTMFKLRSEVEDKLNRLPLSYVDRKARGDLLSRVTNDTDNLAQTVQQTLSQVLTNVLMLTGVITMMIVISPLLSLVAIVTVPLSMLIVKVVARRAKGRFIAQWMHTGALNAQVDEAFTGHSLVKVFGRQREIEERFREENDQLYNAGFEASFLAGAIQPAMMFLGNLNYVAIAAIGGIRVASGAISIGDVQAFVQYSRMFTHPLTHLASMLNMLQSGMASAERIFELLDAEEESGEPRERLVGRAGQGAGRVRRRLVLLLAGPPAHPRPVARCRGRPDGRHRRPDRRRQDDAREPDHAVLRARRWGHLARRSKRRDHVETSAAVPDRHGAAGHVAVPRHDPREHRLRQADATEEELLAAARATYVDRFVHSLPHGYDTVIDDEGGNISAGEKQLITIARAFLADPAILILDEATSSVDTRTEVLVQRAMAALRSNRTSFVIAHRLSTIRDADTILVMDDGQIVEQGNHESLLAGGGPYAALHHAQFVAPAAEVV